MSKRSSGFIQLEWECPQCGGRNPGPEQSCLSCGAPQPDDVEFVAPAERKFIRDENSLKQAKAGADIHCGFCGTRNPATAEVCSQCGGNLAEGERRKAGGEVRQRAAGAIVHCANCGAENPSSNRTCAECGAPLAGLDVSAAQMPVNAGAGQQVKAGINKKKRPWILGLILAVLALCVAGAIYLFSPSDSLSGVVDSVHWQTSVSVQQQQEQRYTNQTGSGPSDAYDVSCRSESQEVCTERTIDQGNGYAEVVQDCQTVNQEYCSYSVLEWQTVQTLTLDGYDYAPDYADPTLNSQQRLGDQNADYTVTFNTDNGAIDYSPDSLDEYRQYQLGSTWTLNLNRLGRVVSVAR
ncbi:MAG: zinc-ribbon domain-containing protein [Anaerolineales bacterium]|nr:zinc-ribbon domain-containing protein [Anaerolineales bacterium]